MSVIDQTKGTARSRLLMDHPGWTRMPDGRAQRGFRTGDTWWAIICDPRNFEQAPAVEAARSANNVIARPRVDHFDPSTLPAILRDIPSIRSAGRVHRVRSPHMWDALVPPILRQRLRGTEAVKFYRALCLNHGGTLMTTAGLAVVLPTPEKILTISDEAFGRIRLHHKAAHLRAIATACVERADEWARLSPNELVCALQTVKHVGTWTARVAVADLTNDFSHCSLAEFGKPGQWEHFAEPIDGTGPAPDLHRVRSTLSHDQLSTMNLLYLDWSTRHQT